MDGPAPLLVVSPHLDDAVFSCGALLAAHPGSTVITVMAGVPAATAPLADWDARCGFSSGTQAMQARRAEDAAALDTLQAHPVWLDALDSQYGPSPDADDVAGRLMDRLADTLAPRSEAGPRPPALLLYPLGLFHSDHRLTHEATRRALTAWRAGDVGGVAVTALAYEDVPYRRLPGLLQQRLVELAREGVQATPAGADPALNGTLNGMNATSDAAQALKRRAAARYASQVPGIGPHGAADLQAAERLWSLAPL